MAEALKLKGSTREVRSCDKCGRAELAGTMILIAVNEVGEEYGDRLYYGTSCAATALKVSRAKIKQTVAVLDRQRLQELFQEATGAWMKRRADWLAEHYGPAPYTQFAVNRYEREVEKAPNLASITGG